jgi:hypothetical protein
MNWNAENEEQGERPNTTSHATSLPAPRLKVNVRAEELIMPKTKQGRLDGVFGMDKFTAAELYLLARQYELRIEDPGNTDDPRWLKRRADRLRHLATQKEKALRHKLAQFKPSDMRHEQGGGHVRWALAGSTPVAATVRWMKWNGNSL